jgi:hypothetical protein
MKIGITEKLLNPKLFDDLEEDLKNDDPGITDPDLDIIRSEKKNADDEARVLIQRFRILAMAEKILIHMKSVPHGISTLSMTYELFNCSVSASERNKALIYLKEKGLIEFDKINYHGKYRTGCVKIKKRKEIANAGQTN